MARAAGVELAWRRFGYALWAYPAIMMAAAVPYVGVPLLSRSPGDLGQGRPVTQPAADRGSRDKTDTAFIHEHHVGKGVPCTRAAPQ